MCEFSKYNWPILKDTWNFRGERPTIRTLHVFHVTRSFKYVYTFFSLVLVFFLNRPIPRVELSLQSDGIFRNIARTYEWGIGRIIVWWIGSFFHIPVVNTDVRYHQLELITAAGLQDFYKYQTRSWNYISDNL